MEIVGDKNAITTIIHVNERVNKANRKMGEKAAGGGKLVRNVQKWTINYQEQLE